MPMRSAVWRWAGKLSETEKKIGVPPERIQILLTQLTENTLYRLREEKDTPLLLTAFHHALVTAHPFPNGNDRHA